MKESGSVGYLRSAIPNTHWKRPSRNPTPTSHRVSELALLHCTQNPMRAGVANGRPSQNVATGSQLSHIGVLEYGKPRDLWRGRGAIALATRLGNPIPGAPNVAKHLELWSLPKIFEIVFLRNFFPKFMIFYSKFMIFTQNSWFLNIFSIFFIANCELNEIFIFFSSWIFAENNFQLIFH